MTKLKARGGRIFSYQDSCRYRDHAGLKVKYFKSTVSELINCTTRLRDCSTKLHVAVTRYVALEEI